MARVYDNDILNMITKFESQGDTFDRIIADVPSFIGRWGGAHGEGKVRDCVSACADIAKRFLTEDGTITISATGVAEERWDEWFEAEGNQHFELVPNSTWAMFRPSCFKSLGNRQTEHFWHRRDDWTYVRTYRRIGSDYTINRAAWNTYTHVRDQMAEFPFPDSMNDVTISPFRSPVHKGLNEAKSFQKWLIKKNLNYGVVNRDDGVEIVTTVNDPGHMVNGYVVQFSPDPADWIHLPKEIVVHDGAGIGFDAATVDKFYDRSRPGLNNLTTGNHRFVNLASWIVATHTNVGDKILDPFCSHGSIIAAAIINGRDPVGVEYNQGRAELAKRVIKDLA